MMAERENEPNKTSRSSPGLMISPSPVPGTNAVGVEIRSQRGRGESKTPPCPIPGTIAITVDEIRPKRRRGLWSQTPPCPVPGTIAIADDEIRPKRRRGLCSQTDNEIRPKRRRGLWSQTALPSDGNVCGPDASNKLISKRRCTVPVEHPTCFVGTSSSNSDVSGPVPGQQILGNCSHRFCAQSSIAGRVQSASKNASENSQMEFEAKSARDGAWYDVACFLSHRSLESGDPEEALGRFSGFGQEEDEWINIRQHVRLRSLPCGSSECVAVQPGDLILCFQEGKEQALYFDAHVLDAQRRRHDVRGCRCRFLVRYDHDQSEEIVPLRKICRRPETDYRLLQLNGNPLKTGMDTRLGNNSTVKGVATGGMAEKQPEPEEHMGNGNKTSGTAAQTTNSAASESRKQPSRIAEGENAGG